MYKIGEEMRKMLLGLLVTLTLASCSSERTYITGKCVEKYIVPEETADYIIVLQNERGVKVPIEVNVDTYVNTDTGKVYTFIDDTGVLYGKQVDVPNME